MTTHTAATSALSILLHLLSSPEQTSAEENIFHEPADPRQLADTRWAEMHTALHWTSHSTTGFGSPGSSLCFFLIFLTVCIYLKISQIGLHIIVWNLCHLCIEGHSAAHTLGACSSVCRHQHQFPGQKLHRTVTGRGAVWCRGGAESATQGAGQSETDAAMPSAITICAAPLQERLAPVNCQHQALLGGSTAGIKKVTILIPRLPLPSLSTW